MALKAAKVTITTTPTRINAPETDSVSGQSVTLTNPPGGATVYIGGQDVTTTDGFPLPSGGSIALELDAAEVAYAVTAGTQTVNCLWRGV